MLVWEEDTASGIKQLFAPVKKKEQKKKHCEKYAEECRGSYDHTRLVVCNYSPRDNDIINSRNICTAHTGLCKTAQTCLRHVAGINTFKAPLCCLMNNGLFLVFEPGSELRVTCRSV